MRIGTLGAARITPSALIKPARQVEGVTVAAIAARDRSRAERFAARHGIPAVHGSYQALVDDPTIEAVYNPLPNSLHAEWTLRALKAGKHVLCEKPLTSNAAEARTVAEAARRSGLVVMEAFHYRYHPLMARALEITQTQLGEIRHIETALCVPLPRFSDIRYSLDLGGGAMMDTGCYAVHCLRTLGPGEPSVVAAKALLMSPGIDRAMTADLRFPTGATGRVQASLWSGRLVKVTAHVEGSRGSLHISNYLIPQYFNRLTVTTDGIRQRERVQGEATYTYQLRAFRAAVRDGTPTLTPPEDSIANMAVIDAIYTAAGLPLRGTS
ncbi:Gfo/Idh/MocA family oxidoreductase [Sphaerisporangium sp. TRM90804]|uniref:Gfo/Idh/MocA family protein n=1 Tax=Sphaerisporangium sp. TRM90804 TaxID=3031113 RepID=UPI00244A312D|nr:Gfo/Idh/MocA family oxidoreductase [Sphaerisporangium sp. TRM90804]MDH2429691.1 Gfo/Idh/MocA family oxidoreductase [Sphaerisporangium sp. TRM90804]